MTAALRIQYRGRVQGVGFRATVQNLSGRYTVAGTVRNCADGSVELFVQGENDEIARFLEAVNQRMGSYISDSSTDNAALTKLQGFHIIR